MTDWPWDKVCGEPLLDEDGYLVFCDLPPVHPEPHGATNNAGEFVPADGKRLRVAAVTSSA